MQVAGAEVLVDETIRRLGSRISPVVFCLDKVGVLGERLQADGVPVIAYGRKPGLDFSVSRRMAADIRTHRIQVIHAHQYTPFFYSAIAARLSGARPRVIFTEHGRHYPDVVSARRRWINRLVLDRLADDVNAVCEFSARSLAEKDGFRADRIHVIPNGIDAPEVRGRHGSSGAQGAARPGSRPPVRDLRRPISPGEGSPHADCRVRAGRRQRCETWTCCWPATANCGRPSRRRCANSASSARVRFLGVRRDVADLLRASDVFALTSVSEAASITLLEAMGAGLPVVVTAVGGNPEIVRDGTDGLLAPRGDAGAAADALRRILGDRGVRAGAWRVRARARPRHIQPGPDGRCVLRAVSRSRRRRRAA